MGIFRGPNIVRSGLVLALDAADRNSFTPPIVVYSVQCYSVYSGGLRSANYTVQYSDDNSTWTTAFTGVMSNNSSCGIITGTGVNTSNLTPHKYWRYVEGAAIAGHHPRVSRIDFITPSGGIYNLVTYTTDNCVDSGTYIVGTVSKDFGPSTWRDISGNNNNGTLGSTTQTPTFSGINGGTVVFDGSNDIVEVTSNLGTLSQYTIMFWARRDAEGRMPVSIRTTTNFYWFGDNSWYYTHGGVAGEYYYSKPTSIPLGTWGCYCVVYNGANVSIYRQGIYQGQQATTGTANWSAGLLIGYWAAGSTYAWQGPISTVMMYNRGLSATEVLQNYNATKSRFGK